MPIISIKAEPIFAIFGFKVTNSLFSSIIVLIIFYFLALKYQSEVKNTKKNKFFYLFNLLFKSVYDLFYSVLKEHTDFFFPLLGSFFFFILLQNWFGLLPGVGSIWLNVTEGKHMIQTPIFRGANADLNTTLGLALIIMTVIQIYGIKYLGFKEYISKFLNLKGPMDFVMGILDIVSELSRVISFSFRLFGNIFAGEVLLTIVAFLVPILASFPFLLLEVFFGLIQALVFTMLSAVFLSMAIIKHH